MSKLNFKNNLSQYNLGQGQCQISVALNYVSFKIIQKWAGYCDLKGDNQNTATQLALHMFKFINSIENFFGFPGTQAIQLIFLNL